MALQFLSLDLSPPVPKSDRKTLPPLKPNLKNGDGVLDDFLTQWRPDVLKGNLDHSKFFHHVVELAKVLTGADGSAIAFRGEDATICRARVGRGAPPLGAAVDTSSGISKDCLEWGMSIRCEDMETDCRVDPETCRALGIRSLAVVPIFCDRKISGILEVFSGSAANFTDQHLQRLQKLARWVGAAASTLQNPAISRVRPLMPLPSAPVLSQPGVASKSGKRVASVLPIDVKGWNHVLLPNAPLPWQRFVASALLHLLIVTLFWGVTEFAPHEIELNLQPRREARVTYYPFSQAAPPRATPQDSRQALKASKAMKSKRNTDLQKAAASIELEKLSATESGATQAARAAQTLPEIASGRSLESGVGGANHRWQLPYLSGVAPAPDVNRGPNRRSIGLTAAAVVPPAPSEIGGGRALAHTVEVSVIPPAPGLYQTPDKNRRAMKSFESEGLVVAPAPSLEAPSKPWARGTSILAGGSPLVPPPASIVGIGDSGGRGRGPALTARNSDVVVPSPSLQEGGSMGGRTRSGLGARSNAGSQIIAPPPSIESSSGGSGGHLGQLGIAGSAVIPPSPALGVAAVYAGRGRAEGGVAGARAIPPSPTLDDGGVGGGRQVGSLSRKGLPVVPAPPSVQGIGHSGSGRLGKAGGLAGSGTNAVPPQPSLAQTGSQREGTGRGSRSGIAGEALPPATSKAEGVTASGGGGNGNELSASSEPNGGSKVMPVFQDAQVKVISLAWAPPKSSYFSNFEVFIAEKWLSKNQTEVIKLVYVFLPYQRRLSEYGAENPRVRKLRVTRDPTCDESLMQISWPEGGEPNRNASMTPEDRKNLLPCYRTTADDYRQAVSRNP